MRLRPTQVETLRFIAGSPDGAIWVSDLAQWTNRNIRSAQGRLERLAAYGLVLRSAIEWDGGTVEVWKISRAGRIALKEHAA